MRPVQRGHSKRGVGDLRPGAKTLAKKNARLVKENQGLKRVLRDTRNLINHIPGALALVQDGIVVLTNETVLDYLGYGEEEVLGRRFLDFVHPRSYDYMKHLHKRRISGKQVPDQYEACLKTRDGLSVNSEIRVNKVLYRRRKAFLVHIVGLEKRRQGEMRFGQSLKMETMARMAGGFARELGVWLRQVHELLLNDQGGISGAQGRLSATFEGLSKVKDKGNEIYQKLDILTRTEYERKDLSLVDLKKIVQDAVALAGPKWQEDCDRRGIRIRVKTYLRTLSPVEVHPEEIRDVFVSLILNAVDALPEGGEVYLTTEEDSGFAYVYVQDNGPGIGEDIRDKIFDPFFGTKGDARSGLGLSLAYAVIRRHKGDIEIMSQKGQGTTFVIKLPLARTRSRAEVRRPRKTIRNSEVLIVADTDMVGDLLRQLFASKDAKVQSVTTGGEALELLERNRPDVAIIDLNTSYLNPSYIVPALKKMDKGLPVILVNAGEKEEESASRMLRKTGADVVFSRPLEAEKVLHRVTEILAK
jgi:two-component system cell cycle sensor histidine kinase/response regulator CckA